MVNTPYPSETGERSDVEDVPCETFSLMWLLPLGAGLTERFYPLMPSWRPMVDMDAL